MKHVTPRLVLSKIRLTQHRRGAWKLQLWPGNLSKLRCLFDEHSFWANGRTQKQLRMMLMGTTVAVSAWDGNKLVGFGRATSDGIFRAVLWDVVVASSHQRQGLGTLITEKLLSTPQVKKAEAVYLMTTNGKGFYEKIGFAPSKQQVLMRRLNN
jgi:ribosomal protein S18 acetylase RimI-like enzyme